MRNIIVIGASAGSIPAIKSVLKGLPYYIFKVLNKSTKDYGAAPYITHRILQHSNKLLIPG